MRVILVREQEHFTQFIAATIVIQINPNREQCVDRTGHAQIGVCNQRDFTENWNAERNTARVSER